MVGTCDGETNTTYNGEVNPYSREVYWAEEELALIQEDLDRADKIVFHNTIFDMLMLRTIGIKLDHLWDKIEDTLLAAHLFASGEAHGLKPISIKYLQYWADDEDALDEEVKRERNVARKLGWAVAKQGHDHFPAAPNNTKWYKQDMWLAQEECETYLHGDVERTYLLWQAFRQALSDDQLWGVYKLRKRLLKICFDITTTGQRMNLVKVDAYIAQANTKLKHITDYLTRVVGTRQRFNINKKSHLSLLLFKHLDLTCNFYTPSGQPATNKEAINWYIKHKPCRELNALQKAIKLDTKISYVSSYRLWCDDNGYIHSNLNPTGTRETRQSSSNPNQQNITAELKKLFEPPPGKVWVEIDFVNIELRIWAYATGNKELIEAFETGQSVHKLIMAALYPKEAKQYDREPHNIRLAHLYRNVKAGNFALIYGATDKKADETYGFVGATALVYRRFPGIKEYTESLISEARQNNDELGRHFITTLGGYPLDVPVDEPFKACNYKTQGSAGMIMTYALIAIVENERYQDSESQIISQVHDSATIEIPIHTGLKKTVDSIIRSMTYCSMSFFGETPVDYEVKYHPEDEENPKLIELLTGS